MTECYAVSVRGKLWPNTVHEHARGAMVNFVALTGGTVLAGYSDEQIRALFLHAVNTRPELSIALERVIIRRAHGVDPATVELTAVPGMAPPAPEGG